MILWIRSDFFNIFILKLKQGSEHAESPFLQIIHSTISFQLSIDNLQHNLFPIIHC